MKFEKVLELIGGFGRYQKVQFLLVCVPAVVIALHQLASVFLAAEPDYECDLERLENENNITGYITSSTRESDKQCKYHSVAGDNSSSLIECPYFIYSTEYFQSTVVTEWDLVCRNNHWPTTTTTVYMAGKLLGALVFGVLSDVIGRKKTMLLAVFLQGSIGLGAAFSNSIITFMVLRLFIGAISTGMYMCLFVLGMELIGKNYRVISGVTICYFFALGYCLLAGIAYLTRNWTYTQIAISAPAFLFLSYYWFVPESARWLISRNRTSEAEAIIRKAASVNKVRLPDDMDLQMEEVRTDSLRHLIKAKTLLVFTLIVFLNWFAVAMGYYGLSLSAGTLPGNIYLNFMISGAVEFVAYSACLPINRLGRKGPHVFGMLVAGLACLATIVVDQTTRAGISDDRIVINTSCCTIPGFTLHSSGGDAELRNTLFVVTNIVGKFGMTMGFCIIYIWSAEIFPTSMRASLMGLSSVVGRIGQILAPYIADLGKFLPKEYSQVVQSSIFGAIVIVAGLLSLYLPETTGREMPETLEEANDFRKEVKEKSSVYVADSGEQYSETKLND